MFSFSFCFLSTAHSLIIQLRCKSTKTRSWQICYIFSHPQIQYFFRYSFTMFMNTAAATDLQRWYETIETQWKLPISWALGLLMAYNTIDCKDIYRQSVCKFKAQCRYGKRYITVWEMLWSGLSIGETHTRKWSYRMAFQNMNGHAPSICT